MNRAERTITPPEIDWNLIQDTVAYMADKRLRRMCQFALDEHEDRFRRAAAAFGNHHARRGGLLEHTSQMLRCALRLAPIYELNQDLLCAGIIFHDIGKIVESDINPATGIPVHTRRGELLGHIAIAIAIVDHAHNGTAPIPNDPEYELLRDHLKHLILSHHGQQAWGSPVEPKTPEAALLHQIDMIDSRMEIFRGAYANGPEVGPGIIEAPKPLRGYLVKPLSAGPGGQEVCA